VKGKLFQKNESDLGLFCRIVYGIQIHKFSLPQFWKTRLN